MGLRLLRFDGARSGAARSAPGEGQQRDIARALDGDAKPTLMTGANAGHTARQDLAALLHELRKNVGALVVDQIDLLDTELADLLFAEKLTLAARTSAGTAWSTGASFAASAARTAFTARTGAVAAFLTRSRGSDCARFFSSWSAAPSRRRGFSLGPP